MANDPGLTNDTCIFMEAIPGDGGQQDAANVWWLSPDIKLVGPVSGPDVADAGHTNQVTVQIHRKPATSNCQFPNDESLAVEVWVANPSLVMLPKKGSSARVIFSGTPVPSEGQSSTAQLNWDVPASLPASNPASAGRKCLVVRSYPSSGVPAGQFFFVPGDRHVAQHNLCVVTNAAVKFSFTVNTINPTPSTSPLQLTKVKLRAVMDLQPSRAVKSLIGARLKSIPGFGKVRSTPLTHGFAFDLTNFQTSNIVDHSHSGGLGVPSPPPPSYEARVGLTDRQPSQINFLADLQGMTAGEACIFHLIQTSLADVAEGGLTLVVLKAVS
jgi:hypothetical protein